MATKRKIKKKGDEILMVAIGPVVSKEKIKM
jgi:hypothetical protein